MVQAKFDSDDLLHGAFYALEQAGRLLHDVVVLWGNERYSSAVVLAVFAREEIGRFKLLVREREEAIAAGPRDVGAVRKLCSDHLSKLRAAPGGVTLRFDASAPELKGWSDPSHANFERAQAILDRRMAAKRENTPRRSHANRLAALYVDFDEDKVWNRPGTMTAVDAGLFLQEVANDYSLLYSYIRAAPLAYQEVFRAYAGWPDRPVMPTPEWVDLSGVTLPVEDE